VDLSTTFGLFVSSGLAFASLLLPVDPEDDIQIVQPKAVILNGKGAVSWGLVRFFFFFPAAKKKKRFSGAKKKKKKKIKKKKKDSNDPYSFVIPNLFEE